MGKILVTGSKGFIGKNLIVTLKELNKDDTYEIFEFDMDKSKEDLEIFLQKADFIFHLAGINRPKDEREFFKGNKGLTEEIVDLLIKHKKSTPILISSSIQAGLDNAYGKSKRAAEEALMEYKYRAKAKVFIYRLPNVFGKWCRPNYNSAVATFCYNIARGAEVWISDPDKEMTLVYIDDVVRCFIECFTKTMKNHGIRLNEENMKSEETARRQENVDGGIIKNKETVNDEHTSGDYLSIDVEYKIKLCEIVDLLNSFKKSRENLMLPDMKDEFTKKLYSTYLSYLPEDQFSYPLKMNVDNRGSFTEFIKTCDRGQVSINISKPGITKGNHWHHIKNEKFLVVSGEGIIQFRKIDGDEIIEYRVSGEKLEVVDIPVGYTHNITNIGHTDMITVMWANDIFNPKKPDTYFLEV